MYLAFRKLRESRCFGNEKRRDMPRRLSGKCELQGLKLNRKPVYTSAFASFAFALWTNSKIRIIIQITMRTVIALVLSCATTS